MTSSPRQRQSDEFEGVFDAEDLALTEIWHRLGGEGWRTTRGWEAVSSLPRAPSPRPIPVRSQGLSPKRDAARAASPYGSPKGAAARGGGSPVNPFAPPPSEATDPALPPAVSRGEEEEEEQGTLAGVSLTDTGDLSSSASASEPVSLSRSVRRKSRQKQVEGEVDSPGPGRSRSASPNPFRPASPSPSFAQGAERTEQTDGAEETPAKTGRNMSLRSKSSANPFSPENSTHLQEDGSGRGGGAEAEGHKRLSTNNPFSSSAAVSPTAAAAAAAAASDGSLRLGSPFRRKIQQQQQQQQQEQQQSSPRQQPLQLSSRQQQLSPRHRTRGRDGGPRQTGHAMFGIQFDRYSRRVQDIRLDDNGLEGVLPLALGSLTEARALSMANNRLLGPLSTAIGDMQGLLWLNLSSNALSGEIPRGLGGLTDLVELNLASNKLEGSIPSALEGLVHLQTLQLQHNSLSGVLPAQAFEALRRLEVLDLSYNKLQGKLPSQISNLHAAREIRLGHNQFHGTLPSAIGLHMKQLKVLDLKHNTLNGTVPEKLQIKLGQGRVARDILPGNRFADLTTAIVLTTRPLKDFADKGLLVFSVIMGYVDLLTDAAAAAQFFMSGNTRAFILAVFFIVFPTAIVMYSILIKADENDYGSTWQRRRHCECTTRKARHALLAFLQLHIFSEAVSGLKDGEETKSFKAARFTEACFEAAPQLLLQAFVICTDWSDGVSRVVLLSVCISALSLAWEATNILDRGTVEAEVSRFIREKRSSRFGPVGGELIRRWGRLLLLWLFHVGEVVSRAITLVLLALALRSYTVLLLAFVWTTRMALGRLTEHSDASLSKLSIKSLSSVLLDSVWDRRRAYLLASALTFVEGIVCIAGSTLARNSDGESPLPIPVDVQKNSVIVAGALYAVRVAVDVGLRGPLHWGREEEVRAAYQQAALSARAAKDEEAGNGQGKGLSFSAHGGDVGKQQGPKDPEGETATRAAAGLTATRPLSGIGLA